MPLHCGCYCTVIWNHDCSTVHNLIEISSIRSHHEDNNVGDGDG